MTPKSIMFKGHKYVLAASSHKRCPDGTHWNELKKKCEKLPPDLLATHKKALKHENTKAKHLDDLAAEDTAHAAHQKSVEHGFFDLAHEHEGRILKHEKSRHRFKKQVREYGPMIGSPNQKGKNYDKYIAWAKKNKKVRPMEDPIVGDW